MMKQHMTTGERTDRIVSALETVSKQVGSSTAQVALAWLRYRDIPVIPIIGARRLDQLRDNLASLDLELSSEQVDLLNQASAIDLGFPHDFYERDMVKSMVYGGMRDKILAA
jgi:aryl-alcohol dehydrogenase-like predicted oxidoreductase